MISREEVREALTGPVASLSTPFTFDGEVDYVGLRKLIDGNLTGGSNSSLLTYGDSLFTLLSDDEISDVTRVVVDQTGKRGLTVAADGGWWTGKTVEFARYCREIGADVLMVKPPIWGGSVTVDTLVAHYQEVAAEIPIMLVTNLWAANPSQGLKTIEVVLDKVDGVVAIKDDILGQFVREMTAMVSDEWAVFAGGQKQNHLDIVHYGAVGYMSTFVSFHAPITHQYWDAVSQGNWTGAANIIAEHEWPFFEYIGGLNGGFDAGIHGLLELSGVAGRWRRKPFHSLNDQELEGLKAFCQSHGWLVSV
jgi:dihydrodipicolinate synthase/N-acetylneuraminate lyase